MSSFAFVVEGLESIQDLKRMGRNVELAAVQAVNLVARDKRSRAARLIQAQINLPKSYLEPSAGRLTVAQKATRGNKEAIIRARGRPTSLARYATSTTFNKAGVRLRVQPGQTSFMKRAFLIKLPGKDGDTETQFNAGLAIRLRPGESLRNKTRQVKLQKNLYLLYGPSVQQVFLDNQGNGVAKDMAPETAKALEAEFLRLLKL